MTNKDPNPLDNKKKWQVVLVILFSIGWPPLALKVFGLENMALKVLVGLVPPVGCIATLPYKPWVRAAVIIIYIFLMLGALQAQQDVLCEGCG